MSFEMRNTLIVEMSKHSKQPVPFYQGQDDATLGGMGAAMVLLRHTGIRDDAALRQMSADDHRNTLIVEMDAQTGQGRDPQGVPTPDPGSVRHCRERAPGPDGAGHQDQERNPQVPALRARRRSPTEDRHPAARSRPARHNHPRGEPCHWMTGSWPRKGARPSK